MLKPRNILILAAVLLAAALLLLIRPGQDYGQAPAIRFSLLDGRQIELSSLAGKPVLVTFWATTCVECRKEMPDLIALYERLSPRGFEMIAVAMPYDPPNRVLELSERTPIPYPIAIDVEGRAVSAFGDVPGTPAAFLVAPDGHIVMRHFGPLDIAALERTVNGMLQAEPALSMKTGVHCANGPREDAACSG